MAPALDRLGASPSGHRDLCWVSVPWEIRALGGWGDFALPARVFAPGPFLPSLRAGLRFESRFFQGFGAYPDPFGLENRLTHGN